MIVGGEGQVFALTGAQIDRNILGGGELGLLSGGIRDGEGEVGVADHLARVVKDREREIDETAWAIACLVGIESQDAPIQGLLVVGSVVSSDCEGVAPGDERVGTSDERGLAGAKVVNRGVDELGFSLGIAQRESETAGILSQEYAYALLL